jgi:hypothetical protein
VNDDEKHRERDRFWAHVDCGGDAECWLWTGALARGYGAMKVAGRVVKAHRFSYEMQHGPPAPGLVVMHTCDNPPCVNPAHLRTGTPGENSADMVAKGRAPRGETAPRAKLSDDDVQAIRGAVAGGEAKRTVAARFGVSPKQVRNIVTGAQRSRPATNHRR